MVPVENARKIALEYEDRFKKIWKKGVDTSHTLPSGYDIPKGKAGGWLFQPYCPHPDLKNNKLYGYSPRGNPLTKEQVEFAIHWRNHPIIRCCVGATEGEGGREGFLFKARQVIEHNDLTVTEEEINKHFNDSLDDKYLMSQILSHDKKDYQNEYTKKYLNEHYDKYLKDINGFWLKELKGVGVLDGFIDPEQEEKVKEFLKNIIYIKKDN